MAIKSLCESLPLCYYCLMTTKRLIGTAEVSKLLGITRAGVNRRVETGALKPAGTIGPRNIRVFDRAEIERLAAEGVTA